jgi:hypothetical protein
MQQTEIWLRFNAELEVYRANKKLWGDNAKEQTHQALRRLQRPWLLDYEKTHAEPAPQMTLPSTESAGK